ncbi:hypothetical protein ABZ917_22595 [Nonomuraea wenchangensis]
MGEVDVKVWKAARIPFRVEGCTASRPDRARTSPARACLARAGAGWRAAGEQVALLCRYVAYEVFTIARNLPKPVSWVDLGPVADMTTQGIQLPLAGDTYLCVRRRRI